MAVMVYTPPVCQYMPSLMEGMNWMVKMHMVAYTIQKVLRSAPGSVRNMPLSR